MCVIFCFSKSESRLGLHSMPKKCWEQTRHTYLRALRSRAAMFSRHRFARPCVPSFFFASLSARLSRPTLRSSWMRFWYGASPITSCTSSRTNCLFMSVVGVTFVSFFVLCRLVVARHYHAVVIPLQITHHTSNSTSAAEDRRHRQYPHIIITTTNINTNATKTRRAEKNEIRAPSPRLPINI